MGLNKKTREILVVSATIISAIAGLVAALVGQEGIFEIVRNNNFDETNTSLLKNHPNDVNKRKETILTQEVAQNYGNQTIKNGDGNIQNQGNGNTINLETNSSTNSNNNITTLETNNSNNSVETNNSNNSEVNNTTNCTGGGNVTNCGSGGTFNNNF